MREIINWLSSYNAEYDILKRTLYIRKPMKVNDFVALKKVLEPYRYKLVEIIIEE